MKTKNNIFITKFENMEILTEKLVSIICPHKCLNNNHKCKDCINLSDFIYSGD